MELPRPSGPSKQTEAVYVSNLPYEYSTSQLNDLLRQQDLEAVGHLNSLSNANPLQYQCLCVQVLLVACRSMPR